MATALQIVQKRFPKVTKIADAKKSLKIEVTQRDTTSSKIMKHEECAMAQACKRKFKLDGAIISMGRAYLIKGDRATRFNTSNAVSREITAFDRGAEFAPGEYHLDAIPKSDRMGKRAKRSSGDKNPNYSSGNKRAKRHVTQNVRASLQPQGD